jgi:branched-subunit amino acid transport protein AzlD
MAVPHIAYPDKCCARNQQANIDFSMEMGMSVMNLVLVFSYIRESYQQQLRGCSLLVIVSYVILRGRWCDIIVLNVHAPTQNKTDDMKNSFYEELGRVFDQFPKHHTKMLLGDFNAKLGM